MNYELCCWNPIDPWVNETVREYRLRVQEFVVRDQGIDAVREG